MTLPHVLGSNYSSRLIPSEPPLKHENKDNTQATHRAKQAHNTIMDTTRASSTMVVILMHGTL
jgi:hypothetical protein